MNFTKAKEFFKPGELRRRLRTEAPKLGRDEAAEEVADWLLDALVNAF